MYESFYSLKENPFALHPDPDYLFMSSGHKVAYGHLVYAIVENKGFVIITGEIGSGKTTLLNYLLKEISQDVIIGLINNTFLSPEEFLRTLCREYEIDIGSDEKSAVISKFHEFLLHQYAEKKRVVLIVDEAQNLPPKTIEAIRMLSNLESEKSHLLQVILVGQPEMKDMLRRPDLQQFAQRVTVHCHLDGLNLGEVADYIKYRLQVAGATNLSLFSDEAIAAIAKASQGIPRLINVLCDTALVYGFADSMETIDQKMIKDVIQERSANGIFLAEDHATEPAAVTAGGLTGPASSNAGNGNGHSGARIDLLEQKIIQLEGLCGNLKDVLENVSHKRDEKDAIIIELLKMLKSNIDSRYRVLQQISEMNEVKSQVKKNIPN
jgi:general secretion pathway protein A